MLLKVKSVSDTLCVSVPKVLQMIKEGILPGIAVGHTYRIAEEDLEEYLRSNKTKRTV